MGCWNKTCGLSSLHITAGTPVYVFVLEENKDRDNNCYSTSLYSPLLLPFESVYNDYGGGEDSSGVALPLILEGLKQKLIEQPLGENEYHDIEVTREKFNEELFFEAVHENRLKIPHWNGEPANVSFTMFHKEIVDDILENHVIEDYVGDGKGTCGYENNYVRYKFADIVATLRPLIERLAEDMSKSDNEFIRFAIFDRLHKYRDEFKAARWMAHDSHRFCRVVDVRFLAAEMLDNPTSEVLDKLEALLTVYLKGVFIDGFMESARKTWIPGGHEGSQSYSGGSLRMLAEATLKILDREKAEWLAENVGDEDEYIEE